MTTEELEQLMRAHKCGFVLESNADGFKCELDDGLDTLGVGSGPSIVEAVYEALKSKCGQNTWSDTAKWIYSESKKP